MSPTLILSGFASTLMACEEYCTGAKTAVTMVARVCTVNALSVDGLIQDLLV